MSKALFLEYHLFRPETSNQAELFWEDRHYIAKAGIGSQLWIWTRLKTDKKGNHYNIFEGSIQYSVILHLQKKKYIKKY